MKSSLPLTCLFLGATGFLALAQTTPDPLEFSTLDRPVINDQTARWELARVLGADRRTQEAIAQYRALLAENPGLLEAKVELAVLLASLTETAEARRLLESIPTADRSPAAWAMLASILETDGDFSGAAEIYRQLLRQKPDDANLRFRLAQVLSWQKKYPEAITEYEALVRQRPEDIQLLRHYARVLGWAGRNREAIAIWQRTLDKPSSP